MTGSFPYTLDGTLFPITPIRTQWQPTQIGTRGNGIPIFAAYWSCEMEFSYMTMAEKAFFYDAFKVGTYHTVILPHPRDDSSAMFTGVVISKFDSTRFDVAGYAQSPKITLNRIMVTGVA